MAIEFRVPARVLVLARDAGKAAEVAFVAGVRATVSDRPVTFESRAVDVAGDREGLADVLGEVRADVLVQCASHQSPWERSTSPSAWTELIGSAGFGFTLPLQSALVLTVAETLRSVAPDCLLINGCFPDAVNPVLRALGLPIFCGIGNISTVAAAAGSALRRTDQSDVRLLAHHLHLHAPDRAEDDARVWSGDVEVDDVPTLLAGMRSTARAELNAIGGHAAARLLAGLAEGAELDTNVPGPLGLPGGYPVGITGRDLALRLPKGIDQDTAVAWNQRMALLDGAQVADGHVSFPDRTRDQLHEHVPDLAEGFPVDGIRDACTQLLDLRDRLRGAPS